MSNFVSKINGAFSIKFDGVEYPNLVVNSGLSNIFRQSAITSLCETLKVFNDDSEVVAEDTDFLSPVATSSNVVDTVYGVSGDGNSDYFYMRRTWIFSRGQISGVINKLAVYSDDGTLYAAALLKNEAGEIEPVRPLFAPKVEITYESRWHFKQGDSYTNGTPVFFSDAGLVIVKTNMASKNDPVNYNSMNEPFAITGVELFSDVITTDDTEPTQSLGAVDPEDYTVTYIDGDFGAYGQKLNVTLPKDKYINDTPIATLMVSTTRGKWQLGFDEPLEKPTLSKREIIINVPFVHGTVSDTGEVTPSGNPGAIDSIFMSLLHSTYDVSTRLLSYDGEGLVATDVPGYFGAIKTVEDTITFNVPTDGTVVLAYGVSDDIETYLDGVVEGITLEVSDADTLRGHVEDVAIDHLDMEFASGDVITVSVVNSTVTIDNTSQGTSYTTSEATTFTGLPTAVIVGVKNAVPNSEITIY